MAVISAEQLRIGFSSYLPVVYGRYSNYALPIVSRPKSNSGTADEHVGVVPSYPVIENHGAVLSRECMQKNTW